MTAKDRGHHLGPTLVGHVHDVDGGLRLEQLGEKLGLIADAGGGVAELGRISLGVGDEFLHRIRRKRRRRNQNQRAVRDFGDRDEAPDRVIAGALDQCGHDAKRRARADQQRGTVGFGRGDRFRSDGAAGSWPVLDHHALAQP